MDELGWDCLAIEVPWLGGNHPSSVHPWRRSGLGQQVQLMVALWIPAAWLLTFYGSLAPPRLTSFDAGYLHHDASRPMKYHEISDYW